MLRAGEPHAIRLGHTILVMRCLCWLAGTGLHDTDSGDGRHRLPQSRLRVLLLAGHRFRHFASGPLGFPLLCSLSSYASCSIRSSLALPSPCHTPAHRPPLLGRLKPLVLLLLRLALALSLHLLFVALNAPEVHRRYGVCKAAMAFQDGSQGCGRARKEYAGKNQAVPAILRRLPSARRVENGQPAC